jgi:NADH-quinone oxidoreductase subunit A
MQGRENMEELLREYVPIVVFIGIALVIGLALLISPFVVAYKNPDPEKLSAYECGFNAFDDARMKFDVRFYLVRFCSSSSIWKWRFCFPWAATFGDVGLFGFWSMMVFLTVLTIGFIYEWKRERWNGIDRPKRPSRFSAAAEQGGTLVAPAPVGAPMPVQAGRLG